MRAVLVNDGEPRRVPGVGMVQHRKVVNAELLSENERTVWVRLGKRIVKRKIARDIPR